MDALLDPARDRVVRRRIPRVLKACATARSAEGLLAALDDPSFDIRAAAAAALAAHPRAQRRRSHRARRGARARPPRARLAARPSTASSADLRAAVAHARARPLQIAWAAMKGDDRALRGTALEYLANVLPEDVFPRLRSLFGASARPAAPAPGRRAGRRRAAQPPRSACGSRARPGARGASGRSVGRVVAEVRRQPALHRAQVHALARGGSRAPGRGRSCRARSSAPAGARSRSRRPTRPGASRSSR